jgi:glycosyltransferase involved in cell wall biosynthesis
MTQISVLIPTFRRPEGFARAARSVFAQDDVAGVELIGVDNSAEGSAVAMFRALEKSAPIPFRWVHEPRPGVANARNAALMLARGEFVAWLDDDEEAPAHWLGALARERRSSGAQSVFGPVRGKAEGTDRAFFEKLYSRSGPARSGASQRAYGIGNSLQPRALFGDEAAFDPHTNQTGGEDDALFASWREAGACFAWAPDAWVIEHVSAERCQLGHGLKRAFAYGQGPCELAWAGRRYLALARHMGVGLAQMLVYGAASAPILLAQRASGLALLGRAARGAGKVFWCFEQRFYGA